MLKVSPGSPPGVHDRLDALPLVLLDEARVQHQPQPDESHGGRHHDVARLRPRHQQQSHGDDREDDRRAGVGLQQHQHHRPGHQPERSEQLDQRHAPPEARRIVGQHDDHRQLAELRGLHLVAAEDEPGAGTLAYRTQRRQHQDQHQHGDAVEGPGQRAEPPVVHAGGNRAHESPDDGEQRLPLQVKAAVGGRIDATGGAVDHGDPEQGQRRRGDHQDHIGVQPGGQRGHPRQQASPRVCPARRAHDGSADGTRAMSWRVISAGACGIRSRATASRIRRTTGAAASPPKPASSSRTVTR